MSDEPKTAAEWGETMQERVLDNLYEASYRANPGFVYDLYGVDLDRNRPDAVMYIQDPEGNCWEVTAKPHGPHHPVH